MIRMEDAAVEMGRAVGYSGEAVTITGCYVKN